MAMVSLARILPSVPLFPGLSLVAPCIFFRTNPLLFFCLPVHRRWSGPILFFFCVLAVLFFFEREYPRPADGMWIFRGACFFFSFFVVVFPPWFCMSAVAISFASYSCPMLFFFSDWVVDAVSLVILVGSLEVSPEIENPRLLFDPPFKILFLPVLIFARSRPGSLPVQRTHSVSRRKLFFFSIAALGSCSPIGGLFPKRAFSLGVILLTSRL